MTEQEFHLLNDDDKRKYLAEKMEKVHADYKEEPLSSDNAIVKKLQDGIAKKGFNFFPAELCKKIDAEAERQFGELCTDILKGVSPTALNEVKSVIIKWYNDEEARFEKFKASYLKFDQGPLNMDIGHTPTFEEVKLSLTIDDSKDVDTKVLPMKKKAKKK